MGEYKVYILKSGDYFKIGVTGGDIIKRIKSLQTGNPIKIKLFGLCPCEDKEEAFELEGCIHKYLKNYKSNGGKEWFCLTEEKVKKMFNYFTFSIDKN